MADPRVIVRTQLLLAAAGFSAIAGLGCTFEPLDLSGKSCDCAAGWVCDEVRNECLPRTPQDGGGRDVDGGLADGSTEPSMDASPNDRSGDRVVMDTPLRDMGGDGAFDVVGDTPDAPPTDVGVDSGFDFCDPFGAAWICAGFERSGLPGWVRFGESGGAVESTERSSNGRQALRASIVTDRGQSMASIRALPFVTTDQVFVRLQLFVPGVATDLNFFVIAEDAEPYGTAVLGLRDGRLVGYMPGGENPGMTSNSVMLNAWNCVEARITVRDTGGEYRYSLNGGPERLRAGIDTQPAGGYRVASVGITGSQPGAAPSTLFIDDLVISSNPIGCE